MICPCCHREMPEEELQRLERRKAAKGWVQHRILEKLERSSGTIGSRDLASYIYKDDPDGGALNPAVVICRAVKGMNERMRPMGWRIQTTTGHYGGYRLERA